MRWIYAGYTKVGGATSRWGRENFLGPLLVLPRPMIIENQQFREPWPKKGSEDSSMAAEGDDDGCELWAHDQRGSRSGSQTLSPWAFAEGLADHHLEGDSVISLTCAFLSGRNKGIMFSKVEVRGGSHQCQGSAVKDDASPDSFYPPPSVHQNSVWSDWTSIRPCAWTTCFSSPSHGFPVHAQSLDSAGPTPIPIYVKPRCSGKLAHHKQTLIDGWWELVDTASSRDVVHGVTLSGSQVNHAFSHWLSFLLCFILCPSLVFSDISHSNKGHVSPSPQDLPFHQTKDNGRIEQTPWRSEVPESRWICAHFIFPVFHF